jgi:hypothetical protein
VKDALSARRTTLVKIRGVYIVGEKINDRTITILST